MWKVIDEAVSDFAVLRRRFEKTYRISLSSWNRPLFVIAIFLSIQDYAIQKNVGLEEVEEILFSDFIINTEGDHVIIDSYNGEEKDEKLYDFFLKMLLVWEAKLVAEEKKEQFLYTIFFYPLLTVLEKVEPNKEKYKDIYKEYTAQGAERDWDGRKIKWTKNNCEEELRNFLTTYDNRFDVVKQQKIFELLDKGYTLREVWYLEDISRGKKKNDRG